MESKIKGAFFKAEKQYLQQKRGKEAAADYSLSDKLKHKGQSRFFYFLFDNNNKKRYICTTFPPNEIIDEAQLGTEWVRKEAWHFLKVHS